MRCATGGRRRARRAHAARRTRRGGRAAGGGAPHAAEYGEGVAGLWVAKVQQPRQASHRRRLPPRAARLRAPARARTVLSSAPPVSCTEQRRGLLTEVRTTSPASAGACAARHRAAASAPARCRHACASPPASFAQRGRCATATRRLLVLCRRQRRLALLLSPQARVSELQVFCALTQVFGCRPHQGCSAAPFHLGERCSECAV